MLVAFLSELGGVRAGIAASRLGAWGNGRGARHTCIDKRLRFSERGATYNLSHR
jgi:hypothetical protein